MVEIVGELGLHRAVIGPIDEDKVPADCFEALCGCVHAQGGVPSLRRLILERLVGGSPAVREAFGLTKVVNSLWIGGLGASPGPPGMCHLSPSTWWVLCFRRRLGRGPVGKLRRSAGVWEWHF
jgi:hypothetical protein